MGIRPSLDVLIGVADLQIASEFGPITDLRARRYTNFIRKVQETLSFDKGEWMGLKYKRERRRSSTNSVPELQALLRDYEESPSPF